VAIVILGKTRCCLCGRVVEVVDDIVTFPSGLFMRDEVAFEVNDAGVHRACLEATSYGPDAIERVRSYVEETSGARPPYA
jgi:hypothetical protein